MHRAAFALLREDGVERLKITPRDGQAVRLDAGRDGRNALPGLGLAQGVVATNDAGRKGLKTFGLGLINADLRLDSKESIASAKAELAAAISMVRLAYDSLVNPNAQAMTDEEKALQARRQAAAG